MPTKWAVLSKTIIGAVLMLLPYLANVTGITAPTADEIASVKTSAYSIIDSILQIGGFAVVVWGRFTATKALTVLPKA